ncbi:MULTISPECIES: hypothetical protein [unclassified Nocardiopsis]|uniref:hypothetical protein n=1 Tax=unclassified Nocardiopsis TaxID=2649073 RepID=UPI0033C9B452
MSPAPRRRSPQEKKLLSYARDRRNGYGENDKSSRRNIARNKRRQVRVPRRRATEALAAARGALDPRTCAEVQERVERRAPAELHVWRKWRDQTLAEYVLGKLEERVEAEEPEGANTPRLERVRHVYAWVRHRDPAS